MKTDKTIKKLMILLLSMATMVDIQASVNLAPEQPVTTTIIGTHKSEAHPAGSELDSEDEAVLREFIQNLKRLPALALNSFVGGLAFTEAKNRLEAVKQGMAHVGHATARGMKKAGIWAMSSAMYAGSQAYTAATQATATGVDCVKNGTVLAQISKLVGSYGEPESTESLYEAMQMVNKTLQDGAVSNTSAVDTAVYTLKQGLELFPTNTEWLQQYSTLTQGATVAAVVVAAAVTYWAAKKAVQKYKKS